MSANQEWESSLCRSLAERQELGLARTRTAIQVLDATHLQLDGKRYINFASNDYLGLSHHPAVIDAVTRAATNLGVGSGASGLISGYTAAHEQCEQTIAKWKGTQAALLLSSGYQANIAAVQTIQGTGNREQGTGGVRFLVDKLAHASLIDALRASKSNFRVFPHNHMAKLDRLLSEADPNQLQVVVTESIFSMDGDAADLQSLAELKRKHNFVLLLDEAHASGVYGVNGSGYARERGFAGLADVTVITLSKAIGLSGGAICGSQQFIDCVTNFGRAWIYSTMMPPMIAAGVERAIQLMAEETKRQERLRALATRLRRALEKQGWKLPQGDSPIIPLILGSETDALTAASKLRNQGLFVIAVRPPTVPKGSSRLRLTLSAAHTDDEIEKLTISLNSLHV